MQLVIVESPSKAKTIGKYLGAKYKVDASAGHIRDLPVKRLGVDVKNNFEPDYEINPDKKQVIERLSNESGKAEKVFLATDPDREGEAISWHLQEVLKLPKDKVCRIEFNEISETAVKEAIKNPRDIDYKLVDSQQARRVLDRLVGYKLSPLLCKRIDNGLSAGRVQSVALELIVDREREILGFKPEEYWNISAKVKASEDPIFKIVLAERDGKKFRPTNEQEALTVENDVKNGQFVVSNIKKGVTKSAPFPPFTTSTLQQEASAKLNISSPITMQIAQALYEGVETPEGNLALVTYIRTDSVRVSVAAQEKARAYIMDKFGKEYVPDKPNVYKTKKNAQDAHEAIRPIDINVTPESVKDKLDKNHYKVYKLIYDRFLASQMSSAKYDSIQLKVNNGRYDFTASGRTILFKGYTAVYEETKPTLKDEESDIVAKLPPLTVGEELLLKEFKKEQKFTKPTIRYTDATLVKAMEDKGIGRPSTYASIISTLSKRKYTSKDGKFIKPTEVAFKITDMLCKYFPGIMNVSFTAKMEDKLDDVAKGDNDWHDIIKAFYPSFLKELSVANSDGDEPTDIVCEKCGCFMIRRNGRFGKYLACSNYPTCSNIRSEEIEVSDVVCDKCGAKMIYKNGKYGKFLACPNYPSCKNIKSLNDTVTEVKCEHCGNPMILKTGKYGKYYQCTNDKCKATRAITESAGVCPDCGKPTKKMTSRKGKIFYGCSDYPNCKFMSWDMPTGRLCPQCGAYTVYSKDEKHENCSNKDCTYSVEIKRN